VTYLFKGMSSYGEMQHALFVPPVTKDQRLLELYDRCGMGRR
jgi:hypothetical protein